VNGEKTLRVGGLVPRTERSGHGTEFRRELAWRMATGHDPSPRRRRRLVAIGLGVWVVVVVVGAGGTADDALLGVEHLDKVWLVLLAIGAILGLVVLVLLNPFAGDWKRPAQRRRGGMWAVLLIALALMVWRPDLVENLTEEPPDDVSGALAGPEVVADADRAPVETVAQATDLLLLAAVLGAVAGGWFLLRRRGADVDIAAPDDGALDTDLVEAIDTLTDTLEGDLDPRSSVLRSYAVLESVLAAHGVSRAAHETPTEHLRRAMRGSRIEAQPFVRLGELYELARFSDHEITRAEQHEAAGALARARATMLGAT